MHPPVHPVDPNPPPDLLTLILSSLPELATFAKEAWEAVGVSFGTAPTAEKKREAREALLAGYAVIDKLRDLPDWADDLAEAAIDALLDHAYQEASHA